MTVIFSFTMPQVSVSNTLTLPNCRQFCVSSVITAAVDRVTAAVLYVTLIKHTYDCHCAIDRCIPIVHAFRKVQIALIHN